MIKIILDFIATFLILVSICLLLKSIFLMIVQNYPIIETFKFIKNTITQKIHTNKIKLFISFFKTYLIQKKISIASSFIRIKNKIVRRFKTVENFSIILIKTIRNNLKFMMLFLIIYIILEFFHLL
jgi:hypothetical protein